MTISNSAATGASSFDPRATFKQTRADFSSLADALQSGDLSSAQGAFAQLQTDNPRLAQVLNSPASSSDNPRVADLKSLASALKSGDVNAAQQAFAKLQQDAKVAGGGHHHHHHHAAATNDGDADDTNGAGPATGVNLNTSA